MLDKIIKEIINNNLEYFFKNEDICKSEYLMKLIIGNVYRHNYDCLVDLIFKCDYLHSDMVLILLDNMQESDFNKKYSDEKTILIKAIENGRLAPKIIGKILEKNVDIDAIDKDGMTAMHYACSGSEKDLERLEIYIDKLLEKGARLDIKDNKGRTPLNCVNWDEYYFGIVDIETPNNDNLFVNIKIDDNNYFKLGNKVAYIEQKIKNIIDKLIAKGAKKEEINEKFREINKDKKINKIKKYFRAFVRDPFLEMMLCLISLVKFKKLPKYCLTSILIIDTITKVDEYKFAKKRKKPVSFLITKDLLKKAMWYGVGSFAGLLNRFVMCLFVPCFLFKNEIHKFLRYLNVYRFEGELIELYNNGIVNNYMRTEEGLGLRIADGAEKTKELNKEDSKINSINDIDDIGETDNRGYVSGIGKNKIQLTLKDRENMQNTKEQGKNIGK